ncbi:MAG: hypothetical protein RLZ97_1036 [Verrucomicrobiota bacterium]|jgi:molybdopterin synthase sulfur carrier subunit
MNTYHVHYFGLLADRRGSREETLQHPPCTALELFHHVFSASGEASSAGNRAAVNDAFVPWDHVLADGDRIAFMPPMSGG